MSAAAATVEWEPRPFVGRSAEMRELQDAVERGGIVRVAGPAGVGKSRLVERAAEGDSRRSFARAELGAVRDLEGALRRIGGALALEFGPSDEVSSVVERIGEALTARAPAVLALDDADAVVEALSDAIGRWGARVPDSVCLVVTTRGAGLRSEHTALTLGPLSIDDGVALLIRRARWVRPDFAPGPSERTSLRALVERVDALPLGIELLAPRLRVLSPSRLLSRLEGGRSSVDPLRRALDRSFSLLSPWERDALAQCTVFADSFDLDGAEAVLDLSGHPSAPDTLTVLESLVESSLLRTHSVEGLPDDVRMRSFAAVRERAAEELGDEARAAAHARHAAYFAAAAERWDAGIESADEVAHTARLITELPNLEAAFGRIDDDGTRARLGLALHLAYQRRGPFGRQQELVDAVRALALAAGDDRSLGRAELAAARVARWTHRMDEAEAALGRAREAAERADDVETLAGCARNLAALRWRAGDLEGFEACLREALEAASRSGRPSDEVNARNGLGFLHGERGEVERAREELEAALRLAESTAIPGLIALTHASLSAAMLRAERFESAEHHASAAIEGYARLGYLRQWALEHLVRAQARLYSDDLAGAHDDAEAALERARWLGLEAALGRALALRGAIAFFEHDYEAARGALEDAATRLADSPEAAALWSYAGAACAMLGHLEGAERAFARGLESGERAEVLRAFAHVGRARHGGEPLPELPTARGSAEARALAEHLAEAGRALGGDAGSGVRLEVGPEARWFRLGEGARVDLTRRRALRGVLRGLVEQRRAFGAEPLSLEAVLEAGWPGERMSPESGARRVYVTVNRLRKLGLGELLETTGEGYALAPQVTLARGGE